MQELILIVEDSPTDAEHLASGLRERQWSVEVVDDGLSALGRMRVDPKPRALVLDLSVPTVDGYSVFDELSNNKAFPKVPVVVVTGSNSVDDDLLEGVAAIFTKPRDRNGWDSLLSDLDAALLRACG